MTAADVRLKNIKALFSVMKRYSLYYTIIDKKR